MLYVNFIDSKIEHNEKPKSAICSCPIKFTGCVLLLKATALNYSVDYYHNSVIGPTRFFQIETLFPHVEQLAGMWDKKPQSRELTMNYNFMRSNINIGASRKIIQICGAVQPSDKLFYLPGERKRKRRGRWQRRRRNKSKEGAI